jgi:1-acyl-sn-glycerol-3-phosphate acyltransferase
MGERAIVEWTSPGEGLNGVVPPVPLAAARASWTRDTVERLGVLAVQADYNERIDSLRRGTNEFGVDPFGVSPEFVRVVGLVAGWLFRSYFRVRATGVENIPEGRVMIIANHSGQIPFDGAMIASAMLLEGEPPRLLRTMVERWSPTIPYVSIMFSRTGQVVGHPENAVRLLEAEHSLLVFPEGAPGSNKMFSKAYQLQEFGLGFMRLALQTGTPIVPVSVVGAEEQYPAIYNARKLARLIGAPAFPVTPFMVLPLVGLLPLPTKYRISFGEPMVFEGDPDDDDEVIGEKVWLVRSTIQNMINRGLREREHVFW